jgi:hypothetical protein
MGRACITGPFCLIIEITTSKSAFGTAKGVLLTVPTRWPALAWEKLGQVAIATLAV